jgi:hypothetical protein
MTSREGVFGAKPIRNVDYYRGPWRPDPAEPRYVGLTAVQFDVAVLGLIAATALAVWLFAFSGVTTARDYLGVEESSSVVSQQFAPPPAAQQPASAQQPADAAPAPPAPAEQPPAPAAPAPEPALNGFLASSAQALNDVQSFRGRFQMTMSMNGESVNSGGDMVFQAPDKMHMTMNIGGQTIEMLALLPNMYIRVPHEGWYFLDGRALGLSPEALGQYMNNRGLFDYQAEAQLLTGIVQLPDEEIDGVPYSHFQGTLNLQTLQQAVGPDLIDPSVAGVKNVSGPVHVDLLLDKTTHLPRRHTVTMDLEVDGRTMSMDMRMAFLEYDGPVTIPEAPEDARPFDSLPADNPPPQID